MTNSDSKIEIWYMAIQLAVILFTSFIAGKIGYTMGKNTQVDVPRQEQQQSLPRVQGDTLSEWQIFQIALIKTESNFNPLAEGKSKDIGILQITPIYVAEVNRILGQEKYVHEDAFDPEKSLEMFSVCQSHHNPPRDISRAIHLHNPGGESIGYSKRVLENVEWIRQYEQVRALVLQGE